MSLLNKDTIKIQQTEEKLLEWDFDTNNNKDYKVKTI